MAEEKEEEEESLQQRKRGEEAHIHIRKAIGKEASCTWKEEEENKWE